MKLKHPCRKLLFIKVFDSIFSFKFNKLLFIYAFFIFVKCTCSCFSSITSNGAEEGKHSRWKPLRVSLHGSEYVTHSTHRLTCVFSPPLLTLNVWYWNSLLVCICYIMLTHYDTCTCDLDTLSVPVAHRHHPSAAAPGAGWPPWTRCSPPGCAHPPAACRRR